MGEMTMIERVARAVVEAEYGKGAPVEPDDLARARTAIEAMREPDKAMVSRMDENLMRQYTVSNADDATELVEDLRTEWIWMRGIDGALEP